jgi:uncharacterized protein
MNCAIYKGPKKPDAYLFVEAKDELNRVPKTLLTMLGELEFVMELELYRERKLAQADVATVMSHLVDVGYFVQMPPSAGHPLDAKQSPC